MCHAENTSCPLNLQNAEYLSEEQAAECQMQACRRHNENKNYASKANALHHLKSSPDGIKMMKNPSNFFPRIFGQVLWNKSLVKYSWAIPGAAWQARFFDFACYLADIAANFDPIGFSRGFQNRSLKKKTSKTFPQGSPKYSFEKTWFSDRFFIEFRIDLGFIFDVFLIPLRFAHATF